MSGLDEGWTERGCTLDVQNMIVKEPERIDVCMESGCNNENIEYSHCINCESDRGGPCSVISKDLSKQCLGIYPYDKRGCFTMLMSELTHHPLIRFILSI